MEEADLPPDDLAVTAHNEHAEEPDFYGWLRANAELTSIRPDTGVLALYLSTITSQVERREILRKREEYLTLIAEMRKKGEGRETLEETIPASITALLTRFQTKLLKVLWAREGELIPYADIHKTCSTTKIVGGGNEVLLNPMKRFRKQLRDLGIGIVFSVEGKGYLFLSNHHSGLSTEALWSMFRAGHGGQSAAMMSPLLQRRPEVVPHKDILESMGPLRSTAGHTRSLSQLITKQATILNENGGQHGEFIVQPDRKIGYRAYTSDEIPAEWIRLMQSMKLWAREADVFIHLLSRGNNLVTPEELMAVSRHEGSAPERPFRKFMFTLKEKVEKAGCTLTPEYNTKASGKPLTGFRFTLPAGSHSHAIHLSASDHAWHIETDPELDETYKLTQEEEVQIFREMEQARTGLLHVCKSLHAIGQSHPRITQALETINFDTSQEFWAHIKMHGTGRLLHLLQTLEECLSEQPTDPKGAHQLALQRHTLKSYMDSYALRKGRLVESMKRWAYKETYRFIRGKKVSEDRIEDYKSCALLGVTKAVDRFDYRRGTRLSTYATYRINQEIQREWEKTDSRPLHISLNEDRRPGERKASSMAEQLEDTRESAPDAHAYGHRDAVSAIFAAAGITDVAELRMFEQARGIVIDPESGGVSYAGEGKPMTIKAIAEEHGVSTTRVQNAVSRVMQALRRAAKGLSLASDYHGEED